ncbi:phosphatidate cytidylyltransferase [Propionivibrio dicarboxylicus]|uniref:Phosphatidate cytidylyltransferase n=1 Tax=Propionivibrio dicarboxylicus TaxID=83767 RepID=A0A1G8DAN5_9RHOO|nr:phosphatidate cytidylyltransferase [Propionivibrio dicarboxylicus]SDH54742.1 phosphatidate cytidylyltransferase [Propionivibrio dicarboxylicus]
MLKTRVLTAVVLLGVFLSAVFVLPPEGWVLAVTLTASLAAWEWGGLMAWGRSARIVLGVMFALVCALIWRLCPAVLGLGDDFAHQAWPFSRWIYLPALAFWVAVVPVWMSRRWRLPASLPGVLIGLLIILPTWLALVQLRQAGDWALLAIMAAVWVADIGAYFVGRRFGRRKLAPSISPGKTWEGAFGAAVAVTCYVFGLAPWLPSAMKLSPMLLALVALSMTVVSILGDLFESLLKRNAGLKDSSGILPGHGGILDRIDSQTSTLPLVALIWLINLSAGAA